MKLPKQSWSSVVVTLGVCLIVISPFWFLASRIDDLDELVKSGVGVTLAGVVVALLKYAGNRQSKGD